MVTRLLVVALMLLACGASAVAGGPARLVKDIHPGPAAEAYSDPHGFVELNGLLYFFASAGFSPSGGLWRTDGTEDGTVLVAPGVFSAYGAAPTVVDGVLFFAGSGGELWRSDGTTAGTRIVKDNSGTDWSASAELLNVGGTIFFAAGDASAGSELWRSDGTEAGTMLVADIHPGPDGSGPYDLTAVAGTLFFVANDGTHGCELWRSDGTAAGTVLVKDIRSDGACELPYPEPFNRETGPRELTDLNGVLFFTNEGGSLWKSDGTEAGTVEVKRLLVSSCSGFEAVTCEPTFLTVANGILFFQAEDGRSGRELWKSDGTEAGTVLVKDIRPGADWSQPQPFVAVGELVYFSATDGGGVRQLWRSDGTPEGTQRVSNVAYGLSATDFTVVDGTLFFIGYTCDEQHACGADGLWRSDGTPEGTRRIKQLRAWQPLAVLGHTLFFSAGELWKSDGTEAGTVLVKDINLTPAGSSPRPAATVGNTLFFIADDGITGRELWRTDGTGDGTVLVKDIRPGPQGYIYWFPDPPAVPLAGALLFVADDGKSGPELWRSDGTTAGTALVEDILPGPAGSLDASFGVTNRYPQLVSIGDAAFFNPTVPGIGQELWRSDGTTAGTELVLDIRPGPDSSLPFELTPLGDAILFTADDGRHGRTLWRSDGTAGGTAMVIDAPAAPPYPQGLTRVGRSVYLSAGDAEHGSELWRSDGTPSGTTLVRDINPGPESSSPSGITGVGDSAFFVANDGVHGYELWRSDGTEAGTRLVRDVTPGPDAHFIAFLTASNGRLFFNAGDELNDEELWVSDGTEAGTHRVADLNPSASSFPQALFDAGGTLLFSAYDGQAGARLWRSDGTEAGTVPVQSFEAPGASIPSYDGRIFALAGQQLFFPADDGSAGEELWSVPLASLRPPCGGDCDNDGVVHIAELLSGVNIALQHANVSACVSLDADANGAITVDELVAAVGHALNGCCTK